MITRREAIALLSIGFTLWCVLMVVVCSAITLLEVNRFGWSLKHSWVHCLFEIWHIDIHICWISAENLNFLISQGSVATCLRWGVYCRTCFVANFISFRAFQKFWKSAKIWQSYGQFQGRNFFETQCKSKLHMTYFHQKTCFAWAHELKVMSIFLNVVKLVRTIFLCSVSQS